MIVPVPELTGPAYQGNTLNQVQRCFNWVHEKTANGNILVSLQGFQLKGTVANNAACRGAKWVTVDGGHLYSVHGNTVYNISSSGSSSALTGTLSTSSGHVQIVAGLSQVLIVDGTSGYIINPVAGTVTTIVDANFPTSPYSAACINGQFLVAKTTTDRWYMSDVDDGLTWTPVISGRAISNSDQLVAIETMRDIAYFFGTHSLEPWTASEIDPYLQPITGGVMPFGTPERATIAKINDRILFYGTSEKGRGSFWMLEGGQPVKIATPYIEDKVSDWIFGNCFGFAYTNQGHDYYEIVNTTVADFNSWIYNITTGSWLEFDQTARPLRMVVNAFVDGTPPIGLDRTNGRVYWLGQSSNPYNQNNGSAITRSRVFGPIGYKGKRVFHSMIRIEAEIQLDATGTTSTSPTLDWTDNGGRTYSTARTLTRTITDTTTGQRVVLTAYRLGSSAERYYRVSWPGAARIIIRNCELDLEEGEV
jgi:hypothetical protein